MQSVSCTNGPESRSTGGRTTHYTCTLPHRGPNYKPSFESLRAKGQALHQRSPLRFLALPLFLTSFLNSYLGDWNVSLHYSPQLRSCGLRFQLSWFNSDHPSCLSFMETALVVCCPSFSCPLWRWIWCCSEVGYFSVIQRVDNFRSLSHWNHCGRWAGQRTFSRKEDSGPVHILEFNYILPSQVLALHPYALWLAFHPVRPPPPKYLSPDSPTHFSPNHQIVV